MKREFRCELKEVDIEIGRQQTREIYEGESRWNESDPPLRAQVHVTIDTLAAILPSHDKKQQRYIVTIEEEVA